MRSPAFQFYAADWLADADVQMMTLEEEGAYIRLLSFCWREGSIPADPDRLSRLTKGASTTVISVVRERFEPDPKDPAKLLHPRLEKEREKQREWSEKSREGGKHSGEVRKKKALSVTGRVVEPPYEPNGNSSSSSSSSSSDKDNTPCSPPGDVCKPKLSRSRKIVSAEHAREFEERIWPVIWCKEGKKPAREAYAQARLRGEDCEKLRAEIIRQGPIILQLAKQRGSTPVHPATWLNQERYDDDPALLPESRAAPPGKKVIETPLLDELIAKGESRAS